MVRAFKHPKGFAYTYGIASAPRTDIFGESIPVGAAYLMLHVLRDGKIHRTLRFSHNHYGLCEMCKRPHFIRHNGFYNRFDSDACAEEAFRRESIDAEENALKDDF